MLPFLVAVFAFAADPLQAPEPTPSAASPVAAVKPSQAAPRTGRELGAAVQAALRRWARPSDQQADQAATEFLALYSELQQDQGLSRSAREQLRLTVRSRLVRLADQITRRVAREKREAARSPTVASVRTPVGKQSTLAQWGAAAGRRIGGALGGPGFGGAAVGGMGFPGGGFGAGMGQSADYGPQLVDLIQRTVAPSSWDVNGGPGTIYYFRPSRALVVRQTDEVHGQLSDALEQLQRAGR